MAAWSRSGAEREEEMAMATYSRTAAERQSGGTDNYYREATTAEGDTEEDGADEDDDVVRYGARGGRVMGGLGKAFTER